ncbi:MAG TPA: S-formylglutathione hydrolase [Thermoanaerobaculia bacterium]|nr:S-formylglutathione hydrolase [Thermoanaerobaculia bacterium]
MEETSSSKCFGGHQKFFTHASEVLGCDMSFAVFLPPAAEQGTCPVLYWLSGLTCTEQNFVTTAGAQRAAAEQGLLLVVPDTSPRGSQVPDAADDPYLGCGAGFYLNATQPPWRDYYLMHDYVAHELPALVEAAFPVAKDKRGARRGISGHSMGGHGAILIALRNPGRYRSLSAFAPISSPTRCPWGQNAFLHYLGEDRSTWEEWDASLLVRDAEERLPMLVDQGEEDPFLLDQLKPSLLQKACTMAEHPLKMRMRAGYDHSYFFVASFIQEHMEYHVAALSG